MPNALLHARQSIRVGQSGFQPVKNDDRCRPLRKSPNLIQTDTTMKNLFPIIVALSLLAAGTLRADEFLPLLKANGTVYSNITVTKVTTTDVFFIYTNGMGNAKLKASHLNCKSISTMMPPKAPKAKRSWRRTRPSIASNSSAPSQRQRLTFPGNRRRTSPKDWNPAKDFPGSVYPMFQAIPCHREDIRAKWC